jgi:predicted DNA-binding transcriptional regulator AlpA
MDDKLLDRKATQNLFGGISAATLWRGIKQGRFPKPIHISAQVRRWDRSECELALQAMVNGRGS